MDDKSKTRAELIVELEDLRRRVRELESVEVESRRVEADAGQNNEKTVPEVTNPKQAEDSLGASERKFRSFIEQSWDLITLFDENGRLNEWNKACEQLTGLTKQEVSGKTFFEVVRLLAVDHVVAQDHMPGEREMAGIFNQGHSPYFNRLLEIPVRSASGDQRILEQVVFPIKTELGFQVGSISRDITYRKLAEEALYATKSKLETIINVSPLAIILLDLENNIQLWNPSAEKIFGWRADEVLGKRNPLVPIPKQDEYDRLSAQVLAGHPVMNYETVRQCKDGSLVNVSLSSAAGYNSAGNLSGRMAIFMDITDRKNTVAALTHSHDLMSYIIEHNRSAIAVHDKDMKYIYVSQRYLDEYNVKEQDVIGRHHYEVFPDLPQKWRDVHQRVLKGEVLSAEDDPYVREDGSVDWTRWECRPWFEMDGSIGGLIVYTEVITERKRAEDELRESEERLHQIIEQMPYPVEICDPGGTALMVNRAFLELFNIPSVDLVLEKYNVFQDKLVMETMGLAKDIRRVYKGEPVFLPELTLPLSKVSSEFGVERVDDVILEAAMFPVFRKTGEIWRVVTIWKDSTEQKIAERSLRESEEQYRRLINALPSGVVVHSQGRIEFVNRAGNRFFGAVEPDQLIGTYLMDRIHPDFREQVRERVHQSEELGLGVEPTEEKFLRLDNSEFDAEVATISVSYSGRPSTLVMFNEISERKKRERELHAIATLSSALRTAPTRAEMLPVIVEQTADLLDCDSVAIQMIEPQTGEAIVEAAFGVWKSLVDSRQEYGTGLNATITRTRKPYVTQNLKQEEHLSCQDWALAGIRGCAGAPLIAQGQMIGFLWIGKKTKIAGSDVELLSAVSNITANAIHRATLHEQTQKDAAELIRAYDVTLEGWARALELRDQETEGHTRRVAGKTLELAQLMGVGMDELEDIRRGALLHDIGKMGIPDSVLLKPGTLNEREWEIMKRHPEYAYNLLNRIEYLRRALDIPYCHHEKWDGTGYPRGLRGNEIPLAARIFAVVDVWDALINDRPYRPAWSEENALKYVCQQSGKHFDPDVVEVFLAIKHINKQTNTEKTNNF